MDEHEPWGTAATYPTRRGEKAPTLPPNPPAAPPKPPPGPFVPPPKCRFSFTAGGGGGGGGGGAQGKYPYNKGFNTSGNVSLGRNVYFHTYIRS